MRISDWSSDVCSSDLLCRDRSSARLRQPLRRNWLCLPRPDPRQRKGDPVMHRALLLLVLALALPATAQARDYGQRGTVFPVIERDLLEQIQSRLVGLEASGETARLNEDLKRRTLARVDRPSPIAGIARASESRSWVFHPTN